MKLAFCLFKYFPYGGLGRDFLRIAMACRDRGHEVDVYTMAWPGERPPGLDVKIVPATGLSNRARCASYVKLLQESLLTRDYDAVVGFNRMPGLDIYYAADVCHEADVRERRPAWLRYTPRHRLYSAFENAVFHTGGRTEILLISEQEKRIFQRYYSTQDWRFHLLPPGISPDRVPPDNAGEVRRQVRDELGLDDDGYLLLLVGSNWRKKGLDRALWALRSLPRGLRRRSTLVVLGKDRPKGWQRFARRLDVEDRVRFLGLRGDVPRFFLAADLLLHPAYRENTGTVLLEALVAGLPVLATEACGYAFHIDEAGAGVVLPSPFRQVDLNERLEYMLASGRLPEWSRGAIEYGRTADLFSLADRAADRIEEIASRESRPEGVAS